MNVSNISSEQNIDDRVEKWWQAVRVQTMKQLPIETAMSLPIPIRQGDKLCLATFYYGVRRKGGPGTSVVTTPVARILATYPVVHLLSFKSIQAGELFTGLPQDGELGLPFLDSASPRERIEKRKLLFNLYPKVIDLFCSGETLSKELLFFRDLFSSVSETPLTPYYRALNPLFFAWLMGN